MAAAEELRRVEREMILEVSPDRDGIKRSIISWWWVEVVLTERESVGDGGEERGLRMEAAKRLWLLKGVLKFA